MTPIARQGYHADLGKIRILSNKYQDLEEHAIVTKKDTTDPTADELQRVGPDKIQIEYNRKSRGSNNRIYLQSQQHYRHAPDFKLPKQFERMKNVYSHKKARNMSPYNDGAEEATLNMNLSVDKSESKHHAKAWTQTSLTTGIRNSRQHDAKSKPSFNNPIINKLAADTAKELEISPHRHSSRAISPQHAAHKPSAQQEDLASTKQHFHMMKTQSILSSTHTTHLHLNRRNEQRNNAQSVSINPPYTYNYNQ